MTKEVHRANDRGKADHGWLKARHSFSFANYYNPEKMQFGALRVLNDDIIEGGKGFGTHPHDNMEIITIPLTGAIKHKDSTGQEGIIEAGEVQIMSAGTGVYHSEFNASEDKNLNLLQTWVFPKEKNIEPKYDQKRFDFEGNRNHWVNVVAPDNEDALRINQDAWYNIGYFDERRMVNYSLNLPGNAVYLFLVEGEAKVEGDVLGHRDAIGIKDINTFNIQFTKNSKALIIEVPLHY